VKKFLVIFVTIIAAIAAGYAVWPFFTPDLAVAVPAVAASEEGYIYFAENVGERGFVFRSNRAGEVDASYSMQEKVIAIAANDEKVWALCDTENQPREFCIYTIDAKLISGEKAITFYESEIGRYEGISAYAGKLSVLAYSDDASRALVYELTPDNGLVQAAQAATSRGGAKIAEFTYDNETIYFVNEDGSVSFARGTEIRDLGISVKASRLSCTSGVVTFVSSGEHMLYRLDSTGFENIPIGNWQETLAVTAAGPVMATAALASNGESILGMYGAAGASDWVRIKDFTVSLNERLSLVVFPDAERLLIVLTLLCSFLVSFYIASFSRRIQARTVAILAAFGVFLLTAVIYLVYDLSGLILTAEANWVSSLDSNKILSTAYEMQESAAFSVFVSGGIALAVAVFIAALFLIRSLHPLREIAGRINEFSEGNFDVDATVTVKGDLGKIQSAVSEMGVSLAIQKYEMSRMADSYYRFVPRNIERILDRAGVMEIEKGDVTALSERLAIVSVENRDVVLAKRDDRGFMQFVNDCFERIYGLVRSNNGILLSGDIDLSALPVLFTAKLDAVIGDGYNFGLNLVDCNAVSNGETKPDYFVLMHTAHILYGIAGTDKRAFPVIASAELNFLKPFHSKLRALGVRMAMTGQYLETYMDGENNGAMREASRRYIGLISAEDGSRNYKIYEILDCLSDKERYLKLSYEKRFQDALALFYKNDFFEALVEFSAILKLNSSDLVVRRYVFASEKYFGEEDADKVRYDLFSADGMRD
jgi:hypothetical protein